MRNLSIIFVLDFFTEEFQKINGKKTKKLKSGEASTLYIIYRNFYCF